MKQCPFCAEEIKDEAVRCKHCRAALDGAGRTGFRLSRSRTDRVLFGVCGGVAEQFDLDSGLVRVGVILLAVFTSGVPVLLIYLVLGLVLPRK